MSNNRNWPNIAAHSMTIGGKHTFRDWSMVPAEIPVFAPPIAKTTYIDIPGANGSLDYTEVLTGDITYENRTGSFSFIVLEESGVTWAEAYSNILNFLQGKKMNCVLDDDPAYFYSGRFAVNEWKSSRIHSTIVIDYNVDPYKYAFETTGSADWLWNELFDNIIYYGTFDVNESKSRNLINPSKTNVTPTFTCSSNMTVTFGERTYTLPTGVTANPGFYLAPGDNNMVFNGTGRVLVDYTMGQIL